MSETHEGPDIWASWLLHRRHAHDAAFENELHADVRRYVDRVLDLAQLQPGMTLLDVGSGEGAVALRAIERVGPELKAVLTDISRELLTRSQAEAWRREVHQQCVFHRCAADCMPEIADGSIDVVATRAALAYVVDKPAALREFWRVLKVGGRIALAEPVFQYDAIETAALRLMAERSDAGAHSVLLRLIHRWKSSQYPDTPAAIAERPMTNFSERTLWEFVRSCGFTRMHMELHVDMQCAPVKSWALFLDLSPHPLAPTLAEILAQQFSRSERDILENTMRPSVESGNTLSTTYVVYFSALKPPSSSVPAGRLGDWVQGLGGAASPTC
ncbi:MAG TPA: class I SAM-dependent methyltransferase [Steroidobacteraceae bacterium]|jgi:ubiquinone/menaquinone biosynthesis C-methylase UbiE|nr:class I SAM-dependent methyltransferase [Steroidobacteraceae bacterium]